MPSLLAPLLDTQRLDLAADAARRRSLELPERAELPIVVERIAALGRALATARTERASVEAEEGEIAEAVSSLVKSIEAAELEHYAGKRKDRDAATKHAATQETRRTEQSALEAREMEMLEAAEAVGEKIDELEAELERDRAERERLEGVLRDVEREVETAVAGLLDERSAFVAALPEPIVAAYERVRAQSRSRGQGATTLAEGRCGACRIKLPSLELHGMLGEPDDALLQCPQCRRVLVRED